MRLSSTRSNCAAALVAAVAFSSFFATQPAHAQRASLAERVDRLEQQQAQGQGNVELVNQINALQSQVQSLQGQNEELKHQLDQLKQQSKDQYIDLDSRIGRIEGHAPAAQAAPPPPPANSGQMQDVPLASADAARPNQPPEGAAPAVPPTAQADAAPPANSSDEKAAYDQAFGALKDGRYAESARAFQAFIAQYPNSELAANAYYWLGESYYVTQNFPVSLDNFNKLLAKYPNSAKASAALLKIGYCQYELKQWDQADATLNQVVQKYPGTQEANLAQGRLRALKLERH